jgi:Arc/MetJ-type ribon-helix-helix transcriptional regulator
MILAIARAALPFLALMAFWLGVREALRRWQAHRTWRRHRRVALKRNRPGRCADEKAATRLLELHASDFDWRKQ